jgi:hypothetical protein
VLAKFAFELAKLNAAKYGKLGQTTTSTFSFNVISLNSEAIELTNAKLPFIFQFAATIARLFIFHS